jgi:hypothetical protein
MPTTHGLTRLGRTLGASAAVLLVNAAANARSTIREPGEHPAYAVELEPHLLLGWQWLPRGNHWGYGLGLRASIPFFDNGPITTINNNLGITFGFDWIHADHGCRVPSDPAERHCGADSFWVPVALQWNFFLTDVISVFGEPGLALAHDRWGRWEPCGPNVAPVVCERHRADTRLRPVLWGGARFLLGQRVAITVRVGIPSVSAGVSLLL